MGPNKGGGKAARGTKKSAGPAGASTSGGDGGGGQGAGRSGGRGGGGRGAGRGGGQGGAKKSANGGGGGGGQPSSRAAGGVVGGSSNSASTPSVGLSAANRALMQDLLGYQQGPLAPLPASAGAARQRPPLVVDDDDDDYEDEDNFDEDDEEEYYDEEEKAGATAKAGQQAALKHQQAQQLQGKQAELEKMVNDVGLWVVTDLQKKGFTPAQSAAALAATERAAQSSGDYAAHFSANRRARTARAYEHLLLNLPDAELPPALRSTPSAGGSTTAVGKSGVVGGVPNGSAAHAANSRAAAASGGTAAVSSSSSTAVGRTSMGSANGNGQPVAHGGSSTVSAEASAQLAVATATALYAAGFDGAAAKAVVLQHEGQPLAALQQLCGALRPSTDDARSAMGSAGKWVGDLDDMFATEMMVLESILGPAGAQGCHRGSRRILLDAPIHNLPGRGSLEVTFDPRGLYPFEPPLRISYSNPVLEFPAVAALNASAARKAVELCGEPFLHALLAWLQEEGATQVAKAQVTMAKVQQRPGASSASSSKPNPPLAAALRLANPVPASSTSKGTAATASATAATAAALHSAKPPRPSSGTNNAGASSQQTNRQAALPSVAASSHRQAWADEEADDEQDVRAAGANGDHSSGGGRGQGPRQQQQQQQQLSKQHADSGRGGNGGSASNGSSSGIGPPPGLAPPRPPSAGRGNKPAVMQQQQQQQQSQSQQSQQRCPSPQVAVDGDGSNSHQSSSSRQGGSGSKALQSNGHALPHSQPHGNNADNGRSSNNNHSGSYGSSSSSSNGIGRSSSYPNISASHNVNGGGSSGAANGRSSSSGRNNGLPLDPDAAAAQRTAALTASWAQEVDRYGGQRSAALASALRNWQNSNAREVVAMRAARERLPAWKLQDQVVAAVRNAQVVVISGETGCGKTTQVPQFLLDDAIAAGTGGTTNIIVTQPRRISATSVAQRIAAERNEKLGVTVGYSIRLESVRSADTRLLLCTTGVLVRRLVDDPTLVGVTHVLVDEVHERSLDSDFLLVLLKELLPRRPDLKLLLMSATVNEGAFCKYFSGCPAICIPGFTHPVQEFFLEDVISFTRYQPSTKSDCQRRPSQARKGAEAKAAADALDAELDAIQALASLGYKEPVLKAMRFMDPEKLNYELLVATLEWIVEAGEEGAVLVFMPGLMEITKLRDACQASTLIRENTRGGQYLIPLHSSLSTSEQQVIFDRAPAGVRKIVIATNIAETSITIDDVVWVLDTGRVKENRYSGDSHMQALVECWVSRASARQRRGRAGRVKPGSCVRLFSRHVHDEVMLEHAIPEMLRVPLEGLALQIKLLRVGAASTSVEAFLAKCLDAPSPEAVAAALRSLTTIGAMDSSHRYLTPLGHHLAILPVDVRVGKMLIYAAMLGCLQPVATIAAAMTGRLPFVSPMDKREQADAAKANFGSGRHFQKSDAMAILAACQQWEEVRRAHGNAAARSFCSDNFLSGRALEEICELRKQLRRALRDAGFVGGRSVGGGDAADAHADNMVLVRAVLVAGLYPNVVRVDTPAATVAAGKSGKGGSGGGAKPPKLVTMVPMQGGRMEEQTVQIHPCSVAFGTTRFESPWLVYREKVETSAVYLRDVTMVSPYPILLFGGQLQVQTSAGTVSVDNWIKLKCPPQVALMFKELRIQLDKLLKDKIEQPSLDIWNVGGALIAGILQLVTTEHSY